MNSTRFLFQAFLVVAMAAFAWPAAAQTTITTSTTINSSTSYASLLVGSASSPGPTLTIASPGLIDITTASLTSFTVGSDANPYAAVVQQSGTVTSQGGIFLGRNTVNGDTTYAGSASYALQGGSILLSNATNGLLAIGRSSAATFTQSGGSITAARPGALSIGGAGDGTYTMTGGTFEGTNSSDALTAPSLTIGTAGGNGKLTINGANAVVALNGARMEMAANSLNSSTARGSATVELLNGTLALNGDVTRGRPNSGWNNGPGSVSFTLGGGTLRPYNADLTVGGTSSANTAAFDITLAANTLSTITGVGWKSGSAHTVTLFSNVVGSGSLQFTGGTVVLSGNNTYSGVTTISAGTLRAGGANAFGNAAGNLVVAGGALDLGNFQFVRTGTVSFTGGIVQSGTISNSTVAFDGQSGTVSATLAGSAGLTKTSPGTLTLSANNSYTGTTTINTGMLQIGNSGTAGSIAASSAITGSAGATLLFNRSDDFGGAYSNPISGGIGLTKLGSGTLTLSGSNSYTGETSVQAGTLVLGNSDALRGSTFAGGAGSLSFGSLTLANFGGLSGSSSIVLANTSGTPMNLRVGYNNANTTFSGTLTGGAASSTLVFQKFGTGTTTISGEVTLGANGSTEGHFVVQQGEIRQTGGTVTVRRTSGHGSFLVGASAGMAGAYTLESGTVLALNTSASSDARIGIGTTGTLTINGAAASARFAGTNNTIGGSDFSGALTSGTGTLNLLAGELAVNSLTTGTAAGSQGTFNFSGGTLRPYSQNTTIGQSTRGFSIALSGNSPTLSGLDAAAGTARNLTIATSLVNASGTTGGITVSGGTVTLSAANTYSGSTTIGGTNTTLVLGSAGSFATSSTIRVGNAGSSGAVLDLTSKTGTFSFGSGQTVGGIGTIRMDAGDTAQFAGTFSPGNSPGIFTFDGGTGLLSGTTVIEIFGATRGTGYDGVDLINGASLNYGGGVLALDFGAWLADEQSYQLFGSGSSSLLGSFSSVTIAGTNYAGLTFTNSGGVWTSQGTSPANQTLTFTEATGTLVIVPEPGAIALAGIGIAAAAWGYRRRRS
jgi:autotransporter-associated beta strand protein